MDTGIRHRPAARRARAEPPRRQLPRVARASGLHPEARLAGAAGAVDPGGSRPHRAGGREDRHRTDLRGRLSALFLGFHHRYVRGRTPRSRHLTPLVRWPSVSVEDVAQAVNRFLRGWAGYFRHGNSARHFHLMRTYATDRLALMVAKRHRARSYGWRAIVYRSPDRYGLVNLNGSVVAPRPNRPWREKPNAGGEGRQ